MADYSEFPTTPTAWQEQEWQAVRELQTEDVAPVRPARRVDLVALVPGLLFIAWAVIAMSPVDVPLEVLDDWVLWLLLIGGGMALLVRELRKARGRG